MNWLMQTPRHEEASKIVSLAIQLTNTSTVYNRLQA